MLRKEEIEKILELNPEKLKNEIQELRSTQEVFNYCILLCRSIEPDTNNQNMREKLRLICQELFDLRRREREQKKLLDLFEKLGKKL